MFNTMRKIAACLLALLVLGIALPADAQQDAQLQLTFIGMYANSEGGYTARNLSGTFDVYQNGRKISTVTSDESGSAPIILPTNGTVQLMPVMDSIAAEIPVNKNGYAVSVISGRVNIVPIVVYANAGLFRVHTESRAEFALISEEGDAVMTFSTDSKGDYALPVAIPAGQYTLRMVDASLAISPWRDKIINLVPYTGPDSVVMIDASYYYTPEITLRPATPTPVATPTATPAPTTAPTQQVQEPAKVTAVPTATPTPTAVPTATPVPTNGTLVFQCTGDEGAKAEFSVSADGAPCGSGTLAAGTSARVPDLHMGDYIVTVRLPEDVLLTGLNGYPSLQRGSAQWRVSIGGGRTTLYEVELSRVCSVSGSFEGMNGVQVSIAGSEVYNLFCDGAFSQQGLTPDVYTVTCVLPEGAYMGEGWSFVPANGQVLAVTQVTLKDGVDAVLPAIVPVEASGAVLVLGEPEQRAGDIPAAQGENESGSASAAPAASVHVRVFVDANNNGVMGKNEPALPGALISLISRENGQDTVVATMTTDGSGDVFCSVPAGEYILRCELPADYGYAKKGSKELLSNSRMEQSIERAQEIEVKLNGGVENEVGIGASEMSVIAGTVWHDRNSDGIWQNGEPGVPGMRITAVGARNGLHYETLTDEEGYFEIRQIRTGTYNISYYVPDGYVFTYKANGPREQRSLLTTEAERIGNDQVIFDTGDVIDEQNIGLVSECVIEGVCFLDANYNGIYDEGEQPLAGVELELFRQSNNKRLRTATSDENGYYRFYGVRSDVFKIKALLPQNYTFSMNVPGNAQANQFAPRDGRREQVVMNVAGENGERTSVLLGAISYGSISGVVYYDDNFSGDWETGEKIAQGITVTLLDSEGKAIKSARTNKSGSYTFEDLAPGEYVLSMTASSGYAFTLSGEGSVVKNDGVGLGVSDEIPVALGEKVSGMDAGMILPGRITGKVFADANDNGLSDGGEKGLAGARVTLLNEAGEVASAAIGKDGAFVFEPLMPGRYSLQYELPEGAVFSSCVTGGNRIAGESGVGESEWFELKVGKEYTAPLCGGLYLGSISGTTFGDSDGSGAQDADEMRLAGVEITLTPSRSELSEMTLTTGADGVFAFTGLHPDEYQLTVRCPEGYVLSLLPDVTLPLQHGLSEQTVQVQLGMGDVWADQPLGSVKPAAYSGKVWLDENMDGLRDADELNAAGEKLVLIEQRSDSVVAEMTTDDDGSFRAEGLAPGLYTLCFALADDVSGTKAGDSTFTEKNGQLIMTDIAIAEGTDASGALLGLVRETTLAGRVWMDDDGRDAVVSGAKLTLMCNGETMAETMSGKEGEYAFDGLMPGDYVIHAELPQGILALEDGDRRTADGQKISILAVNDGNVGQSCVIRVRMAQHQLRLDVGSVKPGRLGDLCWLDLNGNGLQDEGEGGIPGVRIELIRNGAVVSETVSDQYGYYVFENLYPGEYTLRVTAPEEVRPTTLRTDMPLIVSVLQENGESVLVPVKSDGVNYAADLGFVLVNEKKYPAGYGEGATQDWTKIR